MLQENTFQLILATDWTYSFAIFTYPENGLNWGNDPLYGSYSVAGYNVGDGVGYLNLPGSGTENVTLLDEIEGNTGKIGQWVYRIDSNQSLSSEGEYLHIWYIQFVLCAHLEHVSGSWNAWYYRLLKYTVRK